MKEDILKKLDSIKTLRGVLFSSNNNDVENVNIFEEALQNAIGSGVGGLKVYELDASDPEKWEGEKPTDAVIAEIAEGDYAVLHVTGVIIEEDIQYSGYFYALKAAYSESEDTHYRVFVNFDEGDEEEGELPYIEELIFLSKPSDEDPSEREYYYDAEQFVIGAEPVGGIYYRVVSMYSGSEGWREFVLDIPELSEAIDNNSDVIIVPEYGMENCEVRVLFRLSGIPRNGKVFVDGLPGDTYWVPDLVGVDPSGCVFTAKFDRIEDSNCIWKIEKGYSRYNPTELDINEGTIVFRSEDASHIYNNELANIEVNLGSENDPKYVRFKAVDIDKETLGQEYITYVSENIPVSSGSLETYKRYVLKLYYESGNLATSIKLDYYPVFPCNVTLSQDFTKIYFEADDLAYLKKNTPITLKCIWDDGEGHSGAFVMTLNTTQEGGQGDLPKYYSFLMVQEGVLNAGTVEIDSGDTTVTGCKLEQYSSSNV